MLYCTEEDGMPSLITRVLSDINVGKLLFVVLFVLAIALVMLLAFGMGNPV
jgi:hypothetical protein